uniref:Related to metalloprotease n=1 Tax=Melanopsichium pennsylvanicum 4 TaxID=1398559 RepID=A0A077QQ67_9BASI|nr:related to metalloprotease [Melanopsichium pennsylvanicum 4]
MCAFKQLLVAISLFLLIVQAHQASARPVQNAADPEVYGVMVTQPKVSMPNASTDNEGATMDSEAVLKALQTLANGIQPAQEGGETLVIDHGQGGAVDPNAATNTKDKEDGGTGKGTSNKNGTNTVKDSKDAQNIDDTKKSGSSDKDKNKNKDQDTSKIDNRKSVRNTLLQMPRTRFCAQPANTNHTIDDISTKLVQAERKRLAAIREKRTSSLYKTDPRSLTDAKLLAEQSKTVQIVWHVIHSGTSGNLSQTMINDQIQTLNDDYKSYGFNFNLNLTNRVDNATWYRNIDPDSPLQTQMKTQLHRGDEKTLNLYSVDFNNGLLGYATFPFDVKNNLNNDGVVFQYSTVPGGSETGYNLGKTATHEVGHWLGLYHVFQGGCQSPGDYVDDTPPQSTATNGCPAGQDSCRGGGVDSIHK